MADMVTGAHPQPPQRRPRQLAQQDPEQVQVSSASTFGTCASPVWPPPTATSPFGERERVRRRGGVASLRVARHALQPLAAGPDFLRNTRRSMSRVCARAICPINSTHSLAKAVVIGGLAAGGRLARQL